MPGLSELSPGNDDGTSFYFDAVGRDDAGGGVTLVGIVVVLLPAVRKMISSPALACRLSPALSRLRANSKNP